MSSAKLAHNEKEGNIRVEILPNPFGGVNTFSFFAHIIHDGSWGNRAVAMRASLPGRLATTSRFVAAANPWLQQKRNNTLLSGSEAYIVGIVAIASPAYSASTGMRMEQGGLVED
jgi:hypothetical protein